MDGERAGVAVANTRAHIHGTAEIRWAIDALGGKYQAAINCACSAPVSLRLITPKADMTGTIEKTRGPFYREDENFERVILERPIVLPDGESTIMKYVLRWKLCK